MTLPQGAVGVTKHVFAYCMDGPTLLPFSTSPPLHILLGAFDETYPRMFYP
jgi:hypothetical protein